MKIQQLLITLALGLGLTLALLWVLGTGSVLAANFNVTKFTDGNDGSCDPDDCSLREAIQEANVTPGPDTITLPSGTHTLTITGAYEDDNATGDLDITEALTITGAGPDVTIIDASGLSDRVLHVLTGPVVISGVTIRNGSGIDQGGGILNEATLTLINSTVVTNSANYGGGIANQGTVQLTNCTISSNTAHTNGGGIDNGTNSIVELTNSTVSSNTADTDGGGIFNYGGVVTLTGSTVSSNTAYTSGGGIKSEIGGMLELTNSAVSDNIATRVDGGGIDNLGTARLANSTIGGNTAGHDGGGIDNWENSTVELTNSTVSGNTANHGGGIANQGTVQLINCTISSNTAYTNGGGINIWENGIAELTNSTVSSNSASYGGGIGNQGTVQLTNCTISSNSAISSGGGIHNFFYRTVKLVNTIVASQTLGVDCGGDPVSSFGHNLDSDGTCKLTAPGDITANPLLGPLQLNAPGNTATHALLPGSPAINAGSCTDMGGNLVTTDQRGVTRPQGTTCDIGAYEFEEKPTAVTLLSFTSEAGADHVILAWETASEIDNEGFNLWRSQAADGPYVQLNASLIPAEGNADTGASYVYTDNDVVKGVTYYYQLEDVDIHGVGTLHGPVLATPSQIRRIYLPLILK